MQANQSTAKAATDAAADVDKAEVQQALASAIGTPSTPPAAAGGWGADLLQVPCTLRSTLHISRCISLQGTDELYASLQWECLHVSNSTMLVMQLHRTL